MFRPIGAILVLSLCSGCANSQSVASATPTYWTGQAQIGDESTRLAIRLDEREGQAIAEMSLIDVGVSGWPAVEVTRAGQRIEIVFPSDSGSQVMRLQGFGDSLQGTWTDPGQVEPATITLAREPAYQEPEERRVNVDGPVGTIGASIIAPPGNGPFPGIVFVHGSGPQPRDTSRFAAQSLARLGIASIIFDKRGVGESQGDLAQASFSDLADDAVAVARHFEASGMVQCVGFFGHSQGGWIGPLAATKWDKTAFVISSAGPAVPPAREAEWDVVRSLRQANAGSGAELQARRVIELWHDGVRTSDWTAFDKAIDAAKQTPWFATTTLGDFEDRPDPAFAQSYRLFMDYDPIPTLRSLSVPLLSILSPDDESIDARETQEILAQLAAEGRRIGIKTYPKYDHSLHLLSNDGKRLRWPTLPPDYFVVQAAFVGQIPDCSTK